MIDPQSTIKVKASSASSSRSVWSSVLGTALQQPWSDPLILVLFVGIVALVALGWTRPNTVESVSVALFIGGAALTSGAVFGFLFGIPRANQEEKTTGLTGEFRDRLYQVNTNLEQISDWLTKIIV